MTDGVTEKANESQLSDSGLSTKVYMLANPHVGKLKCYGDRVFGLLNLMTPCFQEKLLGLII